MRNNNRTHTVAVTVTGFPKFQMTTPNILHCQEFSAVKKTINGVRMVPVALKRSTQDRIGRAVEKNQQIQKLWQTSDPKQNILITLELFPVSTFIEDKTYSGDY